MRRRPHYTWGSLSNTAPPDDNDEISGYYGIPVLQCPIELPPGEAKWLFLTRYAALKPNAPHNPAPSGVRR